MPIASLKHIESRPETHSTLNHALKHIESRTHTHVHTGIHGTIAHIRPRAHTRTHTRTQEPWTWRRWQTGNQSSNSNTSIIKALPPTPQSCTSHTSKLYFPHLYLAQPHTIIGTITHLLTCILSTICSMPQKPYSHTAIQGNTCLKMNVCI